MFVGRTATGIFHNFTCHWTTLSLSQPLGLKCFFSILCGHRLKRYQKHRTKRSRQKNNNTHTHRQGAKTIGRVFSVKSSHYVYGHRNRSTFQSNKSQSSNAKWIAVKVDLITASAIVCTLCSWTLSSSLSFARFVTHCSLRQKFSAPFLSAPIIMSKTRFLLHF